jgi:hypothetical protein
MAISFPAPEVATKHRFGRENTDRTQAPTLATQAVRLVKRGYELVSGAIFDAESECMRF